MICVLINVSNVIGLWKCFVIGILTFLLYVHLLIFVITVFLLFVLTTAIGSSNWVFITLSVWLVNVSKNDMGCVVLNFSEFLLWFCKFLFNFFGFLCTINGILLKSLYIIYIKS